MVNCTVAVSNQPDLVVAPGESAQLFLDVTPHSDAPMSFSLNVTDGVNTVSQEYTGAGTVLLLGPHRHGVSVSGHCSTGESSALLLLFVPVLLGLAVLTRNSRRPAKA
jgi:hypothetical protein